MAATGGKLQRGPGKWAPKTSKVKINMPALRLFGRRWMTSSDDVPILLFGPTVFHGAWCIAIFVGWVALNVPSHCNSGVKYSVSLAGLAFTFLANFLIGAWLMHEGLKGSIFEIKRRWRVEPLVTCNIFIYIAEVVFLIYGTVVLYQTPPHCLQTNKELWSPNGIMNVLIWTTWAVLTLSFLLMLLTYNFFPDFQDQRSWEHRCRLITAVCCCHWRNQPTPHGSEHEEEGPLAAAPYARLAMLFSQLFGHVDLVPSDVLSSFLLAAAMQRAQRKGALSEILTREVLAEDDARRAAPSGESSDASSQRSNDAILAADDPRRGWSDLRRDPKGDNRNSTPHLFTPSGLASQLLPSWSVDQTAQRHANAWELLPVSDQDLDEAAHYSRYAFAAYGYLLYIWSQPQYRGCCELCCGRGFGLWTGPLRRYFEAFAANTLVPELKITNAMNREAMQQMTGLDDRDIVFVRYVNEAKDRHCLPYFIAVDKSTSSVVLAIRGTLSLEDCLTDFMCEPAELNNWISGAPGGYNPPSFEDDAPAVQLAQRGSTVTAHAGILTAAKAVVKDLQDTDELRALMENRKPSRRRHRSGKDKQEEDHPTHDCRGWRIVVTGHSLGAGVSVLVALYLRNYFPGVFCWAFSPPGGLAEPSVAEAAQSFCTSVALGKDWIPRLTLASFEHLRDEMIMAAARCKISKTAFLLGLLRGKQWTELELFTPPEDAALPQEARDLLSRYRHSLTRSQSDKDRYEMARTFILPGRLMYLRPLKGKPKEKKKRRRYDAVWAKAKDLHGEGIIVSPRMMADHMPDYVTAVLGKLARARRRGNPSFSSAAGPAVGSGTATASSGPARSFMAIDIDTESDEEQKES